VKQAAAKKISRLAASGFSPLENRFYLFYNFWHRVREKMVRFTVSQRSANFAARPANG
jgi:hypothetical protein